MKRLFLITALLALTPHALMAKSQAAFLSPLRNAQFVYVTTSTGSVFSTNPLPRDREAAVLVQNALQSWGHYTLAFRPQDADMIVVVQSRANEDTLAVYDRQSWRMGAFLWRRMARDGLSAPEMPLVRELEAALKEVNGTPGG